MILFSVIVYFLASVSLVTGLFEVSSNTEKVYENEKLMCGEHAAIQSIKKFPVDGPDGKDFRFTLKCLPLKVCDVECEWNHECGKSEYGENVYVSGVQSMFIGLQRDRYLLLLCCNGTLEAVKCSTTKEYKDNAYETEVPRENMFANEMTVNKSPFQEKPFLEMKLCESRSNQTCTSTTAAGYGMNPATMMFAGAAGAAGFAIIPAFIGPSGSGGK